MSDNVKEFDTLDLKVEFGNKIKQAREACNYSIEDVFSQSSIPVARIKEIESGIKTDNNAMLRVYIIKYLKFLNIYNDEMKTLLDQAYENNVDALTHTINMPTNIGEVSFENEIKHRKRVKAVKSNIKKVVVVIVVLLALVALIFFLVTSLKSNVKEVTSNETTLISNTTLAPQDIIDTKPKIEVKDTPAGYTINGSDEYQVKITFKGDAYVQIPNQDVVAKTYKAEDEINLTIKPGKDLVIKTGKIENVVITVNETELPAKDKIGVQTITLKFEDSANKDSKAEDSKKENK